MTDPAFENAPAPKISKDEKRRSDGRADFMKRFFSVAVSVGFASKIGELKFLSDFVIPSREQLQQLILLVFAMTVVVGSWEFYFRSIEKRPLIDWQRFLVDIVIVSFYIVLLLSVKVFGAFLFYINLIMLCYIAWDILSMRAFPLQYGIPAFSYLNVLAIYKEGACNWTGNDQGKKVGPFITFWWFLIFVLLFVFHRSHQSEFYNVALGSALAYILYRVDQVRHWSIRYRLAGSLIIFALLFSVHALL